MYIPQTFVAALLLIIVSMFCWASWANLLKALPNWRLEYFYMDYSIGGVLTAAFLAATMGSPGVFGWDFIHRLQAAGMRELGYAFLGGLVWNIGNILLLNAIMIAGLAVAFPVASALAIILGVGIGYLVQPIGSPAWLGVAVVVLIGAAYTNAASYGELGQATGSSRSRGIVVSLAAGVLIGLFPFFVGRAISGSHALDSYNVSLCFAIGALASSLIALPLMVAKPLIGGASSFKGYFQGKGNWHLAGLAAGTIWCLGTVSNFASAGVVGVAISWGIGSGAPLIAALYGIFLWKEFRGGSAKAKTLIGISMALYLIGVVTVAVSYQMR